MNLMTIMVLLGMITEVTIFNLLNFLTNCLKTMREKYIICEYASLSEAMLLIVRLDFHLACVKDFDGKSINKQQVT